MNFVRSIVEGNNCVFKEIHHEQDYGHDASIILVDGEKVLPGEVAVQIKSGSSYCTKGSCRIPASPANFDFWRDHPMRTYGIVYDPAEKRAYWVQLTNAAKSVRGSDSYPSAVTFSKEVWNRFDEETFRALFFQFARRRLPILSFDEARQWALAKDDVTHELGVKVLLENYKHLVSAWDVFFYAFLQREVESITPYLIYALAHIPWHGDIASFGQFPADLRSALKVRWRKSGREEILKLLEFIDENGFERGSVGQSAGALIVAIDDYEAHLKCIVEARSSSDTIAWAAKVLLQERGHLAF